MSSIFPIAELRTLVARALQETAYLPSQSKRIRAVPDTRAIRYYTTLGLIDRPAEMHGRTAYYNEIHVLQIVAIKRMQASDLSLSDIQHRLAGLSLKKLRELAMLPTGFWEAAEKYLTRPSENSPEDTKRVVSPQTQRDEFWSDPPAFPDSDSAVSTSVRLTLASGVQLIVDIAGGSSQTIDVSRLHIAARPLIEALQQQGLLKKSDPGFDSIPSPETS